ncbi:TetR/AcrR family transcriptional regulator [Microbacterium sp.]|uniref:TetR/AcrR family transcriptional regulator n=1 Tax=Microbacterium sp. TaxID=51671 RepID=UPI003C76C318
MANVRSERARATRARIVDAAADLFGSIGYARTTMQAVADRAGVAVQTVYFVFHSKPELLSATVEDRSAGTADAPPVVDRTWFVEAMGAADARRAIGLVVDHGVDIYARVAPLAHATREAALVDPAVDALWTRINVGRKAGMGAVVAAIHDRGQLRLGLTVASATDICHTILSHETYLELVQRSGWDYLRFKAWLHRTLCDLLLDPDLVAGPGLDEAVAGLSFASR